MSRSDSIQKIHKQLLERRSRLLHALNGDWRLLREDHPGQTGDPIDAASNAQRDEVHGRLIDGESRELVAIKNAIERFEQGTFGVCVQCDRNIPLDRLRAVPYATECIDCRRKAEQRSSPGIRLSLQSHMHPTDVGS